MGRLPDDTRMKSLLQLTETFVSDGLIGSWLLKLMDILFEEPSSKLN
jgi:hypothetical protein